MPTKEPTDEEIKKIEQEAWDNYQAKIKDKKETFKDLTDIPKVRDLSDMKTGSIIAMMVSDNKEKK